MLRWLLTIISLQFLLGLGVSAWAHTAHAAPALGAAATWSALAPITGQCETPHDAAAAHEAPADDGASTADGSSVDLPDDQDFQRPPVARLAPAFAGPWRTQPPLASLVPPQRLRPPRA